MEYKYGFILLVILVIIIGIFITSRFIDDLSRGSIDRPYKSIKQWERAMTSPLIKNKELYQIENFQIYYINPTN